MAASLAMLTEQTAAWHAAGVDLGARRRPTERSVRAALRAVTDLQVTPTQCVSAAGEWVSGPASA
jgi:hypothetical protein